MKKFVIIISILVSLLALQVGFIVWNFPIEGMFFSFVTMVLLLIHTQKDEHFWEDFYLPLLTFFTITGLVQTYSFFPELFVFNHLLFYSLLFVVAILVVLFWKYKFEAFPFVVFVIMAFPLLGLVELWGTTKIWAIVGLLAVPFVFAYLSSSYNELEEKVQKTLNYFFCIAIGFSVFVSLVSTIIQFWVSEPWYGGSRIPVAVIILGAIGTGIWFLIRKEKKRRLAVMKATEEIQLQKIKEAEREKELELQKEREEAFKTKKAAFTKKIIDGENFLFLDAYNLFGDRIPKEILLHLTEKSLDGMLRVSTVKSQIIFDRRLVQALFDAYEHLFFFSFDDDELKIIAEKLNIVLSRISALQFKTGYDSIIQIVGSGKKLEMYKQLKIKDYQKYSPNNL